MNAADCYLKSGLSGCLVAARDLAGGGGARTQTRLHIDGGPAPSLMLVRYPAGDAHAREAQDFWSMAELLMELGDFGPRPWFRDADAGWYIVEDLGDQRLLDLLAGEGDGDEHLLRAALTRLLALQVRLKPAFREGLTQHAPCTPAFFRQQESGYFQRAFLQDVLGFPEDDSTLHTELERLAGRLSSVSGFDGVLLRDVQSTNLLRDPAGQWRFIDFQGARRGPWQYDVMSLIYDPYTPLSLRRRSRLLEEAARSAETTGLVDSAEVFLQESLLVGLHRMLQALGAYAKLGVAEGRLWFLAAIPRALAHARFLAGGLAGGDCPRLSAVLSEAEARWAGHPARPRAV